METQALQADAPALSMDAVIGRRVHHLMWDRQLTQTAFSQKLGMQQSGLAKKLRGQRGWSADELIVVARELGVTVGYLFAEEDPTTPLAPANERPSD